MQYTTKHAFKYNQTILQLWHAFRPLVGGCFDFQAKKNKVEIKKRGIYE